MNIQEHLLTILMEECVEIAQRASKALRFGIHEIQEGHQLNNAERIMQEYDDLQGVIQMLRARAILPESIPARIQEKIAKVEKYLLYSQKQGTLQSTESIPANALDGHHRDFQ